LGKNKEVCRKCVSCRQIIEKSRLFRVVRDKEGNVSLDEKGCAEGRGAYICKDPSCIENAYRKNTLDRSFRAKIRTEDKERVFREISELEGRTGIVPSGDGN